MLNDAEHRDGVLPVQVAPEVLDKCVRGERFGYVHPEKYLEVRCDHGIGPMPSHRVGDFPDTTPLRTLHGCHPFRRLFGETCFGPLTIGKAVTDPSLAWTDSSRPGDKLLVARGG